MKKYGQELESEKKARDNSVARDIVNEINNFGINERQRLLVLYQLALELENIEYMRGISSVVKEAAEDANVFISNSHSDEEETPSVIL